MRVVVLAASPRPDGNSRALADALAEGARGGGHEVEILDLNGRMTGFLRDCRRCRRPDGECSIADGHGEILDRMIDADAIVYATPLYWYGMAAALKNVFDRMVCRLSASHPRSQESVAGLAGTRAALLLSSEERYPGAALGVIAQIQEMSRYLRQPFVGVVHGVANARGEIVRDPEDPLAAARRLGAALETAHHSDYRADTERSGRVWGSPDDAIGTFADA